MYARIIAQQKEVAQKSLFLKLEFYGIWCVTHCPFLWMPMWQNELNPNYNAILCLQRRLIIINNDQPTTFLVYVRLTS